MIFIYMLWWLSGTCQETVQACPKRDQLIRSGLGLVFLLNYAALVMAWMKVGFHFFHAWGFVPGLLVPSTFLALDRLIAMRHRHLTGILAVYNMGVLDTRREIQLRLAMALALSVATTLTFMIEEAGPLIRDKADTQWKAANKDLRKEHADRVKEEFTKREAELTQQSTALNERRTRAKTALDDATSQHKEAAEKTKNARDEQSAEDGGLDGRPAGQKSRWRAQKEIADRHETIAAEAATNKQAAETSIDGIDTALKALKKEMTSLQQEKNNREDLIDAAVAKDARFTPKKSGLFYDATLFTSLYTDPETAAGIWMLTPVALGVLLTLELAALLALHLIPCSTYDIALIANLRVEAAKHVADAEIKLAQRASQSPPIQVRRFAAEQVNQPHQ